jgi:hypothetical protein
MPAPANDEAELIGSVDWRKFRSNVLLVDTGCWQWTGGTNGNGYGLVTIKAGDTKVRRLVHRISYVRGNGAIADGLVLDHLCRNTLCCNPAHLEPVTNEENVRRAREAHAA